MFIRVEPCANEMPAKFVARAQRHNSTQRAFGKTRAEAIAAFIATFLPDVETLECTSLTTRTE